ncbi:tetratricopeptide repeat protein [Candidatus Uabimicrobium amorphum]|uniref:Tetratricopeptide repeat protein n=1 Tax=Uabimicrobium amorphum TaxID=2596890 RepID=A0A5S9F4A1_UABAM|nr:tetratricopeptide repeat protein [Candidatus Uabimicrobium amorphum]BBM85566.1 hypothetical protein UABAM_03936 [Candidatus Uabimicrobium amorphum]
MTQSLDDAFCNYVISQEIISKETISFVKDKYPSVCVREALLLDDQLQIEYYTATVSILNEQNFAKSDISEYWDKRFIAHIKKIEFLTDQQIAKFQEKCLGKSISFRELLVVTGILPTDEYINMFHELLVEHTPNSPSEFGTSEMEFIEKTIDSMESSLKKSSAEPDASEKTVNPDLFSPSKTEDASTQTLNMVEPPVTNNVEHDASAMTVDAVEGPIRITPDNYFENDASAMTVDSVVPPITPQDNFLDTGASHQQHDASAMTIDAVEPPLVPQENFLKADGSCEEYDASAMTVDAVEPPLTPQENSSGPNQESDASAMTVDAVEPPFVQQRNSYFDDGIGNDVSAMTVDAVESPVAQSNSYFDESKMSSSYFSGEQEPEKEENIDTAKTIASDITFSEYMESLNDEKATGHIESPAMNTTFTEQTLDKSKSYKNKETQRDLSSIEIIEPASPNPPCDASSETLIENLTTDNLMVVEDRVETVKEEARDEEATLDMNSQDINVMLQEKQDIDVSAKTVQSDSDFDSYGNTVIDANIHGKNREMEDAFPSSIVEQIDGLDEKTTNLTNLIREMRESQVLQVPPGFAKRKSFAGGVIVVFLLVVSAGTYVWFNLPKKAGATEDWESLKAENEKLRNALQQKQQTSIYYDEQQYDLAIGELLKQENITPQQQFLLAKCYYRTQRYQEAEKILRKLTKLYADNKRYTFFFAKILTALEEEPVKIFEFYNRAQKLGFPEDLVLLEKLNINVRYDLIDAEEFEKKCAELPKDLLKVTEIKGHFYSKQKQWKKAVEAYNKLLEKQPLKKFYFARGKIHYEMSEWKLAYEDFRVSAKGAVFTAPSYYHIALILARVNKNKKKAFFYFRNAIEHDASRSEYFQQRGWLFFTEKQYANSVKDFEAALKRDPQRKELHGYLALAYEKQGKKSLAEKTIQLALQDKTPEVFFVVSQYYRQVGEISKAISMAQKSIKLAPKTNWQAYELLGDIYQRKSQKKLAKDNWGKALEIKPYSKSLRGKIK